MMSSLKFWSPLSLANSSGAFFSISFKVSSTAREIFSLSVVIFEKLTAAENEGISFNCAFYVILGISVQGCPTKIISKMHNNRKKKTLVKHFFEFFNFDGEKKVFRTVRMIMTKIPAPI